MQTPPVLANEAQRIAAVHDLEFLDTATDVRFGELVELAAFVAHTPMAALSLIDTDRQWFSSILGLDTDRLLGPGVTEVPRDISLCGHTIEHETMVVPDTKLDPRFDDNPFVVNEPHVRFYAGSSLVIDGQHVGTLCVMDNRPRTFLTDERRALEILTRQASAQLELRRVQLRN